jgi:hypothetical protein
MPQLLLFPDPRPLVERLGREFFQNLPVSPGVYLMRDATDTVLYVGKAKNLKRRLSSYRVANPERIPRRHLRLWWALHPNRSLFDLPAGWIHGRLGERARIALTADNADAADNALLRLQHLLRGELEFFSQWIQDQTNAVGNSLELAVRDVDLETIRDYLRKPLLVSQPPGRATLEDGGSRH